MKQIAVSVLLYLLHYTCLASDTRACYGDVPIIYCTLTPEGPENTADCKWDSGDNDDQTSQLKTAEKSQINKTLCSTEGKTHCLRFLSKVVWNISDYNVKVIIKYTDETNELLKVTTRSTGNGWNSASVTINTLQNCIVTFNSTDDISSKSMLQNITYLKKPCDASELDVLGSSHSVLRKLSETAEQSETPTATDNAITSQHMTMSSPSEDSKPSSTEDSREPKPKNKGLIVGAVAGAVSLTVVIGILVALAFARRIRPFRFGKHCFESRHHREPCGRVNEHFEASDSTMNIEENKTTFTTADDISKQQTERFQQDNTLSGRFKDNHDSSRINQNRPPLKTVNLYEEDSGSNYVPVTVIALYENNRQADPFEEDSDGYFVPVTLRKNAENKQHTEPFDEDSNGYLGPVTPRAHAENKQQTEQFDEDSNGYFVPVTPRAHAENKQQTEPFDEDSNGNLVPVTIRTHAENKQQTKQFDEDSDGYSYLVPVTPSTRNENKHHAEQFEEDTDSYEVPRQRTDDGGNIENQAQILDNDNNRKYGAARFYLPAMARKAAHGYDNCLDFVDAEDVYVNVNTATEKQLYIDEPIYDNNIAWTGKDESTDVHVYAKDQGRSHYEEMNLI